MAKRPTKKTGVVDLRNGNYMIRVAVTDPKTGRRREIRRRVEAESMTDAKRLRSEFAKKLLHEAPVSKQHSKLGEFATEWLAEITTRTHPEDPDQLWLCKATRLKYEFVAQKVIMPFFHAHFVDKITAEDVTEWRTGLVDAGFKRATVNTYLRVMRTMLRAAKNFDAARVPELNAKRDARITRKEPNLLNAQELDLFLAAARRYAPHHYALILVLFTSTMRVSTALALRRDDLDLETMEFVVQRRLSEGEETPGVKRARFGEDTPPLLPEVLLAIQELWATYKPGTLEYDSQLMFPATNGGYHSRTILRKVFKRILAKAGIKKRFTPHGCRRTGAKLYGKTAGTRLAMEIAGHMTPEMHAHYAPIGAEEKQDAARKAFSGLKLVGEDK